ncbi:DNA polymerase [Methanococcoides sp. AM1]|uniref:DNA polymerase n=1 Tax=Methanococcoides sp. AM1 TaxID=1201011 RepID=UPI0010829178|nr:DNA polymerase [Methanococcoides sp. AM1]
MSKIAARAFTQKCNPTTKNYPQRKDPPLRYDRVLVFDTETTTDQYQNMKIGHFEIFQDGYTQHEGLFYDSSKLDDSENKVIEEYSKNQKLALYTLEGFVDEVFYPETFNLGTLCVGFNLAFDIIRIAKRSGDSKKGNKGGFTLTLSDNPFNPPIIIRKMGESNTYKFSTTKQNKGEEYFSGHFLDAQTLGEVLLQKKHISLEKACELLDTKHKKIKDIDHGTVTKEYIDYMIMDVKTTYDVYRELLDELDLYQIDIPLTKIFSAASLGKHALKQLGVQPFHKQNPLFLPDILGNIMTAYFGGRCECMFRKQPKKVTVLDFTSMYPTVTMVLDLWKFIIAEKLQKEDATSEIKELLSKVSLEYLQNKENWEDFVAMVKIIPDEDILPVRMDYKGKKSTLNVGLNYLSSKSPMWFSLPDVISSVLLTGKVPEIIEAIRFVPSGVQDSLVESSILGINLDPRKDNLIQTFVEERQKIKTRMKSLNRGTSEYRHLSSQAQAIKILVNAMSYGIFIELNPEDKKSDIEVYGLDSFDTSENRYEKAGKYFHPLLAVMITSGSRLFLSMAEAKVKDLGSAHAYMDTDSVFVPPEHAQEIIDYFQPLNPYDLDISLLKPEKDDMWFYGICSKRYALYNKEGDNFSFYEHERSYKLHGLGHLTNPFPNSDKDWHADVWLDILRLHYGIIKPIDIEEKYSSLFAVSRLTVSTANVLKRFKTINDGQPWSKQIKPFNFCNVGFQTIKDDGKPIKPLAPFSKDPQKIVYEPFLDYNTGEIKQGMEYFKTLSRTILEYANHPEYKYEGDIGQMKRRHIHADSIVLIGKEANNIDDQALDIGQAQVFINKQDIMDKIMQLDAEMGRKVGIAYRGTLKRIQDKIKLTGDINLNTNFMKELVDKLI